MYIREHTWTDHNPVLPHQMSNDNVTTLVVFAAKFALIPIHVDEDSIRVSSVSELDVSACRSEIGKSRCVAEVAGVGLVVVEERIDA